MSGFMSGERFPLKAILIGTAAALAVTLALLCVICGVMTISSGVPYDILPYILLIADAGGAFCGAYCSAVINKSRGLILGLICGFILFVILFIAGSATGESIGLMTLLRFIVLVVFGILGGIKGVNKKEKLHIK